MSDQKDAKSAIEDLRLEERLAKAGAAATSFAQSAVTKAGGFAQDHRETAHEWLGRAEGGRAHDAVAKVRSGLAAGVDLVAEQGPGRPDADPGDATTDEDER